MGIAELKQVLPIRRTDSRTSREEFANLLFMLADALGEKYDEHPVREDLDLSIDCTAEGVRLVVHDHTTWVEQLANLGIRYAARYVDYETEDDFAPAASALRIAYERGEWDEAGTHTLHFCLTRITDIRHLRIGGAENLARRCRPSPRNGPAGRTLFSACCSGGD